EPLRTWPAPRDIRGLRNLDALRLRTVARANARPPTLEKRDKSCRVQLAETSSPLRRYCRAEPRSAPGQASDKARRDGSRLLVRSPRLPEHTGLHSRDRRSAEQAAPARAAR